MLQCTIQKLCGVFSKVLCPHEIFIRSVNPGYSLAISQGDTITLILLHSSPLRQIESCTRHVLGEG